VEGLQRRAAALGGSALPPDGTAGFHLLRRLVGWRLARRFERVATRYGLTRSGISRLGWHHPLGRARRVKVAGPRR
jgi:hypothetical protein